MRAGFNWEMGPFQLWDAAGVLATVERMRNAGERVSPIVERLLAYGNAVLHPSKIRWKRLFETFR